MWEEASCFFTKERNKTVYMVLQKFYFEDEFGLLIDLRSMGAQAMHGSGIHLVNTTDDVQLDIKRSAKGSGDLNCHMFVISYSRFSIL